MLHNRSSRCWRHWGSHCGFLPDPGCLHLTQCRAWCCTAPARLLQPREAQPDPGLLLVSQQHPAEVVLVCDREVIGGLQIQVPLNHGKTAYWNNFKPRAVWNNKIDALKQAKLTVEIHSSSKPIMYKYIYWYRRAPTLVGCPIKLLYYFASQANTRPENRQIGSATANCIWVTT